MRQKISLEASKATPDRKGIPGNEIADEIAKSAQPLVNEPFQEIQKSLKTIYRKILERAHRRIRAKWYASRSCAKERTEIAHAFYSLGLESLHCQWLLAREVGRKETLEHFL